jgi:hypothetical protein
MNKLLKEAIADAKAVRETALANAKIALEEAFQPKIQRLISARLAEEEEADMDSGYDEDGEVPVPVSDDEPIAEEDYVADGTDATPADNLPEGDYSEDGEGLDLEAILRELEGDDEPPAEEPAPAPTPAPEEEEEPMDEEIDINEIIRALSEADDDEDASEPMNEEDEDKDETDEDEADSDNLKEAYRVIKFMQSKLNEVNLLNAKLLFSNKLFRNYELNESQKMKVIENFDRANSLREVKLVYSTICESLTTKKAKKQIKESYASKPTRSTAPKKEILSEGNQLAARWKKLANLK